MQSGREVDFILIRTWHHRHVKIGNSKRKYGKDSLVDNQLRALSAVLMT